MPFYSQAWLSGQGSALRSTHLSLGHHPETGDELLMPDKDRTMGVHFIGKAGSGKSSAIKNLVYQDALKQNAVILLDPHSDLADECVAELPRTSIADTFVLDMRDEAWPYGVNLFSLAGKLTTEEERTQAIERIFHIFAVLWPEIQTQQHLPMMLRCTVMAFLDNPGSTLVDMLQFFRDDDFHSHILAHVKDRTVRDFFQDEHAQHSADERRRRVTPLVNRLQSLFVGRALPRNILGQRVNSVDFRKAIEQRQLIFVKLPTTTMREDARLIGTILMAQISAAIFSFVDTSPALRPGVSLYVDEVSQFTTPDFERLVVEGRKFGVRLSIAHQNQGQLPDYLQRAANGMHTQVMFRVTSEDAKALAPAFPVQKQEVARDAVDPNATKYLLDNGTTDPLVKTFIDTYLRPLQRDRHRGRVDIEGQHWSVDWGQVFWHGLVASVGKRNFYVDDPTPYLDNLLREVMHTGNPMLPIPWEAVAGFANCGMSFFSAVRHANGSPDLTDQVQFPAFLANQTANGYVWLRRPESENEQWLHCIFHLRMVMMALAEQPIIRGGKTPSFDFAQALIQLPVRMALVKSGDDVGQIVTNDTPRPLIGEALQARRSFIQQHTRQRYCHQRDQIEQLIDSTTPPDEFTLGRWEAVEAVASDDGASSQSN